MIFWLSLFVITVTMDWLIVNASTEEEELVAAVLGIIAMIMILVYFAAGIIALLFGVAGFILNTSSGRVKGDRILRWQLKSAAESCFIFSVLFWMAFGFHLICTMGGA